MQKIKSMIQKLDALVETEAKKKHTHHVLLAVQSGNKVEGLDYRKAAGSDGANPRDPFFVASITKMMTATVIFQLVDEGLISLKDPIAKYLPFEMINGIHIYKGRDYSSKIRISELLHQTSGIPDYFQQKDKKTGKSVLDNLLSNNDVAYDPIDFINTAKELTPMFEPSAKSGNKSFYSDTNYQLLGAIMEHVTGESVSDNFESRIFSPLGLSKDTYVYDKKKMEGRIEPITMYNKEKKLFVPNIMSSFHPDGGVVSTLDDMLTFLRAYFDAQLFDKKHKAVTTESERWNTLFGVSPLKYSYGLMRFKVPKWMTLYCFDCPELLGHSGSNSSFAFYSPDKDVFMVGTFNQNDQESRPFQFMLRVLNALE